MATKVSELIRRLLIRRGILSGRVELDRPALGVHGESLAARELTRRGYRILARRWTCRFGEIDIVARDGDVLVIVEVKTRTGSDFGRAVDAVDHRKQERLVRLARAFLALEKRVSGDRVVRFDVVGVELSGRGRPRIEVVRNAFDAQDF